MWHTNSYTLRTLHAWCIQSELTIRECSTQALLLLVLYNCSPNLWAHEHRVGCIHTCVGLIHLLLCWQYLITFNGALGKFNIIPNFFSKKVGIFIPLEVLAWVKTACRVLRSRLTYFWRNMNISSIFYFSKSTSINTQYSSLWDTLKLMLFT